MGLKSQPKPLMRSPKNTCVFCGARLSLSPPMNKFIFCEENNPKPLGYVCYPYCEPPIEFV